MNESCRRDGTPTVDDDTLDVAGLSIPQTVWSYEKGDSSVFVIVQTYPNALDDRTVVSAFDGAIEGLQEGFDNATKLSDVSSTDEAGRPTRHVSLTGDGLSVAVRLRAAGNHLVMLVGVTPYDEERTWFVEMERSFSFV